MIKASDLGDNAKVRVTATCDYCGCVYTSTVRVLRNGLKFDGTNACSKCAARKARLLSSAKRSLYNYSRIAKICDDKGYELITKDDGNIMTDSQIEYKCPIHGVQYTRVDSLLHGHGCYYCGRETVGDKLRIPKEQLERDIASINNNKLLNADDYVGVHDNNLKILCACGNHFVTSYNNYMKYNVTMCKSCSKKAMTSGERIVANVLDEMSVPYIFQYKFDDCVAKRRLPFDFYLPDYNSIVEFDGPQHFFDIPGRNHQMTAEHDKIKNAYCDSNGIPILRISYIDSNKTKQLVSDFLNR